MKYIITESQHKMLFLQKNLNNPEILKSLKGIIKEGFWYTDPCEYLPSDYESYKNEVIFGAVPTFINSYEELYSNEDIDHSKLEKFIHSLILYKFESMIKKEWDERECDEDDDEDDMFL
jgi:hypothetical protein